MTIALREKREWAARKMEHNEETPNPPGKETWRPEQKYYEREYYEHNYHTISRIPSQKGGHHTRNN